MIESELNGAARLAIAGLIGLGVGLEREWSGHTRGPDARFAGLRTFLLLGLLGGSAGLLAEQGFSVMAAICLLGGIALSVAAYVFAVRRPGAGVDGTTEAAALVVVVLAALAGLGWLTLAAGAGSIVVLALSEKNRLHGLVRQLGEAELHAALLFTVLAVVVLPLLPPGPVLGDLAIKPRTIWVVVLLFSGLNFAGYVARRLVGAQRGYGIAGALGGVISSTAVTLNFARASRTDAAMGIPLARGVIAACTVLIPRVLIVSGVLNPHVAIALAPLVGLPFVAGLGFVFFAWRGNAAGATAKTSDDKSPLRLASAIQMAVAFQVAIILLAFARSRFGTMGLYATAAALGLTDMDALTMSMSNPTSHIEATLAARALAIGILANTLLKLSVSAAIGRSGFRLAAGAGLLLLAAASAAGLWLM